MKKVIIVAALLAATVGNAVPKQAQSSSFFPLFADRWYKATGLTGGVYGGSPSSTVKPQPDHMSGFPAYIAENATQFDEVAIYIRTNYSLEGAEATVCIYEMQADGMPGALADESNPIDLDVDGKVVQSTSSTISLNIGWHIFMLSFNSDFTGELQLNGTNSGGGTFGATEVDGSEYQARWYKLDNTYATDNCPDDLSSTTVEISSVSHCYGSTCQNDSYYMPAFYLLKK